MVLHISYFILLYYWLEKLYFKLIITLLVTCFIINTFFESLVNDTFSNLKLNAFIISFIIINRYMKQVVLIYHSWISHMLQRGWGFEFCLFSKKKGRVYFSAKKGEVGKIVEKGC